MARAGRKPLPPGERKVRQHLNLSADVVEWLDTKNNKSAYVEALIERDMTMQTQKWIYGVERECFYQIPKSREAMETHLEFGDALPTRDELLYAIGCQESMSGEPVDRDAALAALEIAKA